MSSKRPIRKWRRGKSGGHSRAAHLPRDLSEEWRTRYEKTPYRELPWFSPRPYPWVEKAVRSGAFTPGTRILDIGCGAGTNAIFLARSGFNTSGVDLAPAAILAAQRRAERAKLSIDFREGDALNLPYPRAFFGGLTDVGCYHTIPLELRPAYARELARILRPRGRYVLAWVAREAQMEYGPPHRPSVEETASAFETDFLFRRTEFHAASSSSLTAYWGLLERRTKPQPPGR
jgi:SAM-dependent methyltransferase